MPQLGNLSKLIHLDLNSLSRDIYSADLAWLSRLTTLQYLDLSRVNLSKVIDWAHVVNKLPSLVTLRLAACGLRNAIPSPLQSNLTSLEELDLYGNEFSTSSIGTKNLFWDLPSLLHLDMSGCGLQGSISQNVGNMTSITRLHLSDNNLTSTLPTAFKNLHNLEELDLSENSINGKIAVLLERFPAENRLQELILFENKLTGNLPSQLGHLRNFHSFAY
jgi:Leucine-rich repeat (LRR) protein